MVAGPDPEMREAEPEHISASPVGIAHACAPRARLGTLRRAQPTVFLVFHHHVTQISVKPGPCRDDAALILSEFVTNALRHARALNSGMIRVSWELSPEGLLRIEVTDGGGTTRPSTKPYSMSVSAHAGRGLEIVDRLADRWGSQREEGGDEYTVWAELAVRAR